MQSHLKLLLQSFSRTSDPLVKVNSTSILTASTLLHRLFTQCPGDTVQTLKFKYTTAALVFEMQYCEIKTYKKFLKQKCLWKTVVS